MQGNNRTNSLSILCRDKVLVWRVADGLPEDEEVGVKEESEWSLLLPLSFPVSVSKKVGKRPK